jgi:hypothetical protein
MAVLEVLVVVGFTTQAVAQEILRQRLPHKAATVETAVLALYLVAVVEVALLPLVVMQRILAAAVVMGLRPPSLAHL